MPNPNELLRLLGEWNALEELRIFMDQGGNVLWVVFACMFLLWVLVLERHYYFWKLHNRLAFKILGYWQLRRDHHSWYAHKIRQRLLSMAKIKTEKNLPLLKGVILIAPLLGLLGTVTGMIDVFNVMSLSGAGNTRAMAAGVSRATIPTMAGMVVSLIGILFDHRLQRRAQSCVDELSVQLDVHEDKGAAQ